MLVPWVDMLWDEAEGRDFFVPSEHSARVFISYFGSSHHSRTESKFALDRAKDLKSYHEHSSERPMALPFSKSSPINNVFIIAGFLYFTVAVMCYTVFNQGSATYTKMIQ